MTARCVQGSICDLARARGPRARQRTRLSDVHRHRGGEWRARRVPRGLHDAVQHQSASLPRLPLGQEPHVPCCPDGVGDGGSHGAGRAGAWPRCSASRLATRSTSSSTARGRPGPEGTPILEACANWFAGRILQRISRRRPPRLPARAVRRPPATRTRSSSPSTARSGWTQGTKPDRPRAPPRSGRLRGARAASTHRPAPANGTRAASTQGYLGATRV